MSLPQRGENDPHTLDRTFLNLANEGYQESRRNRVKYAQIARECGLTNQEIADAYGVTEAAIRQMLKRAAAECGYCYDSPKRGHYCADCGRQGAEERN